MYIVVDAPKALANQVYPAKNNKIAERINETIKDRILVIKKLYHI